MLKVPPEILYLYMSDPDETEAQRRKLHATGLPESEIESLIANQPSTNLLETCRFKLSKVGNLNDLFDAIPALKKPKEIEMRRHLPEACKRHGVEFTEQLVEESMERQWKIYREPFRFWPEIAGSSRLLCLSSKEDRTLLWSHYASRHKGFAVGFRTNILSTLSPPALFAKVRYQKTRPAISPLSFRDAETKRLAFQKLYFRKSPEWQFEEEWRALLSTQQLRDHNFLPFPREAIESITLGAMIDERRERLIKDACIKGGISGDITVKQARLCQRQFRTLVDEVGWRV